jgi:hypothetical protein
MTLFCQVWVAVLHLAWSQDQPGTKPNAPIAPSLPALTDEEEARLDGIIDRFMRYDTGKLGGAAGTRALEEFQQLGNEAIPALLRGLRKAAELEHSCPVTVIAKKLRLLLGRNDDRELLEFARDEITGIDSTRYRGLLTDLRVGLTRRQADLDRLGTQPRKPTNPLARLSIDDLNRRIRTERQEKVLIALGKELTERKETAAADGLGQLASSVYPSLKQEGSRLLGIWMGGRDGRQAAELLRHESAPVRLQAARRLVQLQDPKTVDAMVLLKDPVAQVREGLHADLVGLAGKDVAKPGTTAETQGKALELWLDWWSTRRME